MIGPYEDFWILGDIFFRRSDVIFGADVYEATICNKSDIAVATASLGEFGAPGPGSLHFSAIVGVGVLCIATIILLTITRAQKRSDFLHALLLDNKCRS